MDWTQTKRDMQGKKRIFHKETVVDLRFERPEGEKPLK